MASGDRMKSMIADPGAQQMRVEAERLRLLNREAFRAEQLLPNVRWKAFKEQRLHEDTAALRFEAKLRSDAGRVFPATLAVVFKRLRRRLDQQVRNRGGTEASVLRSCFHEWDAEATGTLDGVRLRRAFASLGLRLDEAEAEALTSRYDAGGGLVRYEALCEDAGRFCQRHFLQHPDPVEAAAALGETPRSARALPPLARRFVKKLRRKLAVLVKRSGEYERILIRRAFLAWDADASGKLNARELVGAVKQLGLSLSESEAREVVAAFDLRGEGEMTYQPVVEVVCEGVPHFTEIDEEVCTDAAAEESRLEGARAERGLASAPTPEEDLEDEKLLSKLFTTRLSDQTPNVVVEEFKLALRKALERKVLHGGGTVESCLREAFLFWDGDASGELDVQEFRGAMKRVGLDLSRDAALQVVRYYDRNGEAGKYENGEIHYKDIIDDVSRGVDHFLAHPSSSRGVESSAPPIPGDLVRVLEVIRDGVVARLPRLADLGDVGARDLLLGTCLRVDRNGAGKLGRSEMRKIFRELRVEVRDVDLDNLVAWYDSDGSRRVPYRRLSDDVFRPRDTPRKNFNDAASDPSLPRLLQNSPTSSASSLDTTRIKMARIEAEKEAIQRRLHDLQRQQRAAAGSRC